MKKLIAITLFTALFFLAGTALAGITPFTPDPIDLNDLDHGRAYSWGIDGTDLIGETIIGATLFFDDIRNWRTETSRLYVRLFDNDDGDEGVLDLRDLDSGFSDYFDGEGTHLRTYYNLSSTAQDITYTFEDHELAALSTYIANNGFFGVTFDPDCHFYNNGVYLYVETKSSSGGPPVPEPATLLLFGSGLVAFAGIARKRSQKK